MKKITLFLILSMVIVFSAEAHKYKNRKASITISIQTFYDQLSPYGDWIYTQDNGYVWRPYFDNPESFRPYSSNGNWIYTDYGWTWSSGYDWGWATFHYGRWDFDNYLGWMWIPGYEWAPAWVTWGSYDNYWGWAPMGPNIYVQSTWYAPDPWWTFVPQNHFCSSNWNHYIYNRPVRVNHITHITNVYVDGNNHNNRNSWYNGPRVNDVERYSKSKVRRVEVADSQRPDRVGMHNNTLNVYRPAVDNKRKDVRPTEYRNVEQARTGKRIEQTNARTNDPGVNRTRDSRTEIRNTKQATTERNVNSTKETRVEPRTSTQSANQSANARRTEIKRNSTEAVRTVTQSDARKNSSNSRSQVEQRNGSQISPSKNSTRPSVETKKETSDRKSKINVTEGNRPISNTNRVVNTENSQSRKSAPTRENVNNNSSRGSQKSQSSVAQPTREQRTQGEARPSNSRSEKTEIKQATKEQVQKAVSKTSDESRAKRSSGKPTGR